MMIPLLELGGGHTPESILEKRNRNSGPVRHALRKKYFRRQIFTSGYKPGLQRGSSHRFTWKQARSTSSTDAPQENRRRTGPYCAPVPDICIVNGVVAGSESKISNRPGRLPVVVGVKVTVKVQLALGVRLAPQVLVCV